MNPKFWRSKRVFLTGHTGFKGSWMSLWLQNLGAEVIGYALKPPTNPSLYEIARVGDGMQSIIGDICNYATLQHAMQMARPDIVIHMAAQPLVRFSYQNPVETYATNVMGTVHVLEAVRNNSTVKAVVNITTDKCYENREWIWGYRENEPLGGYDPYSNSKGCAELVSAAYRSSFFNANTYNKHGVAIATARAGNVIGGGDWAKDRLLPDILSAFAEGTLVYIRNPYAIRPWQHVLEPLHGYLTLAECLYLQGSDYAEAWNFGPNDEDAKPVAWIVEKMSEMWGPGASWQIDTNDHPHEATFLRLDCSKARSRLSWRPSWGLEITLKSIVDWQKAFLAGQDIRETINTQIASFVSRII